MTPRQADVAFVLEGIAGVRAVYAVRAGTKAAETHDFAIELEPGGEVLAAVQYALLLVLSHPEIERVFTYRSVGRLPFAGDAVELLHLSPAEREDARARIGPAPSVPARSWVVPEPPVRRILIVDANALTERSTRNAFLEWTTITVEPDVVAAARHARAGSFDLILCDAESAFEPGGLLSDLPPEINARTLLLASPSFYRRTTRCRARQRSLVLLKPWEPKAFRESCWRVLCASLVASRRPPTRRSLSHASVTASPRLLLIDIDAASSESIRAMLGSADLVHATPDEAIGLVFDSPFHVILTSASAALAPGGLLDKIEAEDRAGASRLLITVPQPDRQFVEQQLRKRSRQNQVLSWPLDEVLFRQLVMRAAPYAGEEAALRELPDAPPKRATPPRYRRMAVLVVDDDLATQILFSAGSVAADADVALVTSPMAAFEHVLTRAVDVLVISTTLRGDGGEPFYRVMWRLKPELKARTVLLTALSGAPRSARIVERPLSRAALADVVSRASR